MGSLYYGLVDIKTLLAKIFWHKEAGLQSYHRAKIVVRSKQCIYNIVSLEPEHKMVP